MDNWGSFSEKLISYLLSTGFSESKLLQNSFCFYKKRKTSIYDSTVGIMWTFQSKSELYDLKRSLIKDIHPKNAVILCLNISKSLIDVKIISQDENYDILQLDLDLNIQNKKNINVSSYTTSAARRNLQNIKNVLANYLNSEMQFEFLTSLIMLSFLFAQSDETFNSHDINYLLGKNSLFYHIGLNFINKEYNRIEDNFKSKFKIWTKIYNQIYSKKDLNKSFFLSHSYFSLVLKSLLYLHSNSASKPDISYSKQSFAELTNYHTSYVPLSWKDPFEWCLNCHFLLKLFDCYFFGIKLSKSDIFTHLYQNLISISSRQSLGEFYTPKELVMLMIDRKFINHHSILDPSCGSGSFLVEILRKIERSNENKDLDWTKFKIFGIDINPIAVQVSYTNIILFLENLFTSQFSISNIPKIRIYHDDALFPNSNISEEIERVDLIISNPPWINLSGIISDEYKLKLKKVAKKLKILYGVEAKNTEICSIFFYQCRNLYLAEGGHIFFVLPASILNGHQHVFFRFFYNFIGIEVWKFSLDIFKVHSICIYAENSTIRKENKSELKNRLKISAIFFSVNEKNRILEFSEIKKGHLEPIYIKRDTNSSSPDIPMIGRYNPVELSNDLSTSIFPERSEYYKKIRGGLRIVPRRWVCIKERPPFSALTKIHPDLTQQAKKNWSNPPFDEVVVESEYIHAFLKSQGLIPFMFIRIDFAFVPITFLDDSLKINDFFNIGSIKPNAKKFYQHLDSEYRKNIKQSASMKTLADNFTYNGRLIPSLTLFNSYGTKFEKFILVHNSIGSIVKAAVLNQPFLLDNSLYYFITEDENEAYYLAGVLNSKIMTNLVKKIGSTGSRGSLRNIHKNPYNFPIPLYQPTGLHLSIAECAKKMEGFVKQFLISFVEDQRKVYLKESENLNRFLFLNQNLIKVRTIQNKLLKNKLYQTHQYELDNLIKSLFQNEEN